MRAASQNMTGGDYEHADDTILQAEKTANTLFGKEIVCLRIRYDDFVYKSILPSEMTDDEKEIFTKILNNIKNR